MMQENEQTILLPKQFRQLSQELGQAQLHMMKQARRSIGALEDPAMQSGHSMYYDALSKAMLTLKAEADARSKQPEPEAMTESDAANMINEAFNEALDAYVDAGHLETLRNAHGGKEAYGAQRTADMTELMDMSASILHEIAQGRLVRAIC